MLGLLASCLSGAILGISSLYLLGPGLMKRQTLVTPAENGDNASSGERGNAAASSSTAATAGDGDGAPVTRQLARASLDACFLIFLAILAAVVFSLEYRGNALLDLRGFFPTEMRALAEIFDRMSHDWAALFSSRSAGGA